MSEREAGIEANKRIARDFMDAMSSGGTVASTHGPDIPTNAVVWQAVEVLSLSVTVSVTA